ncbi:class I SAM-dependent methyltransferase [Chungangia koreensis]|uniref:Class I SAM-dependent methyltransferase n=1 Tax=Chungangia koreensis TaxID=752657 RepID=A0ABV8X7Q7_9LACT
MIVTTAGRPDEESMALAKAACIKLSLPFKDRKKRSVSAMIQEYGAEILVAGKNRYAFYTSTESEPFFFHPNSAAFRLKRMMKGEVDPFVETAGIDKGDTILDCTLGMGSDCIIASFAAGAQGKVRGCEVHPVIAFIVQEGLRLYKDGSQELLEAMRRIEVIPRDSLEYLKEQPDKTVDIVYLDPMFEEVIEESDNFQSLRAAGFHTQLSEEWVNEAKRVARKRIILKAHFRSDLFEQFGFERKVRLASKFHYGTMTI